MLGMLLEVVEDAPGVPGEVGGVEPDFGQVRVDRGRVDRVEQSVLAAEVRVQHRLVAAGHVGDPVHPRAGDPPGGELLGGGRQDPRPGPVGIPLHTTTLATIRLVTCGIIVEYIQPVG
jgi:hypothetical protein